MSPKTQKDMAVELGLSKQNFNSHWTSAKVQLILDYLEYYKTLIVKYNQLWYGNTPHQWWQAKARHKRHCFPVASSTIHAGVAYLFVAEWTCWIIPAVIFVTHFMIDFVKCKMKVNSLCTFLVDQFCHIMVIAVLWFLLYGKENELSFMGSVCSTNVWIIGMAYILMLKPSSILLSLFLDKWTPTSSNTQSLPNAGQWIGYIERVLILTFDSLVV